MDFEEIISTSFRYPFKDYKHLSIIFVLFALTLILPIGIFVKQSAVAIIGVIALIIFILIFPGYLVSIIKHGIDESSEIPNIKLGRNIKDTFKLFILHVCYIAIPSVIVFIILAFATGLFVNPMDWGMNFPRNVLSSIFTTFGVTVLIGCIFSIISHIAKARMANTNSLVEALKLNKVFKDIKQIGVGKFIGWYIVMVILIGLIRFVAGFLVFVPYLGIILYLCIVYPIISLIFYYSLGLLYSGVGDGKETGYDIDLEKFEKEIQDIKYGRLIKK